MKLNGQAARLRIIVGETDLVYQRPLYEAIVFAAKKYKLSGATVSKGAMNYGAQSIKKSIKVFELSEDRPMIIELIDYPERLRDFASIAQKLIEKAEAGGIITIEDLEVIYYG